ncbi:MAG TPA: hypothetical protein VE056_12010 [Pyrinomonadaceae bacterium]|nr:hypothetical protein [Pyrinomonadaceae bacterium]
MLAKANARRVSFAALILFLSLLACQSEATARKKKPIPKGTPVLWRAPEDIASRDLYLGPGGAAMKPSLRRIKFIKEVKGGYSKKYRIRDAAGRVWVAKIGKEAQSETAAVRLLWAAGYVTEINYLVPRLRIPGQGTFENVRLEARPRSLKRLDEWKWDENPFVGTREFAGLKTMMVLFNNWDIKDSNNVIILAHSHRGNELRYVISDLGATFGKTGTLPLFWRITRSRNNPQDYEKAKFVEGVRDNGVVNFRYGGKKREIFDDITVPQAKWLGELLAGLSVAQIKDAFRAANYSPEEIGILTEAVQDRIEQLRSLP